MGKTRFEGVSSSMDLETEVMEYKETVSIAEIAATLVRQSRTLFVVLLFGGVITSIAVWSWDREFDYSTVIELGTYLQIGSNSKLEKRAFLEEPIITVSKLKQRLIPEILLRYRSHFEENDRPLPEIHAALPKDGGEITLKSKSIGGDDVLIKIQNEIAEELVKDHLDLVDDIILPLKQEETSYLVIERRLGQQLASSNMAIILYQRKLDRVQEHEDLLIRQLERIENEIASLSEERRKLKKDNSDDAMPVLIIDIEIKNSRVERDRIEEKLTVDIQDKRDQLTNLIEETKRKLVVKKLEYQEAVELSRLAHSGGGKSEASSDLGSSELVQSVRETRIAIPTTESFAPVNRSKIFILVLGVGVTVFVAFVSCLLLDLFQGVGAEVKKINSSSK